MILFIARADWVAVGFSFAKALRSIGVEAMAIAVENRPLIESDKQAKVVSFKEACELCKSAEWIVFMHSQFPWKRELLPYIADKKIAVFHGGSSYRQAVKAENDNWNPIVDLTLIQMPSMMGLGAKNEYWMIPPIDINNIQPVYRTEISNILRVGHFPTSAKLKGTAIIEKSVNMAIRNNVPLEYFSGRMIEWCENLKRMAYCDIIVSQILQSFGGHTMGEWGITALEAAALGKIVLSTFNSSEKYSREYGSYELIRVDDDSMLLHELQLIAKWEHSVIREKQQKTRAWVEKQHSMEATGQRLKQLLS